MRFSKLRIAGFKSFVDPIELLIEPGLTGIVGPNGCGKSNLVEALRWVMGETSAKQLRGGEMDDVIFAGSGERPGRNIAEVSVELDNAAASAPPPWTGTAELLVSRRIERARGSAYRVNGREVRARDVHLLFADAASGARSAAMVTQGQVSQLIAAKPVERRALLEEAAGIVGLHTRRNEAEQRLQAAEGNLARLDDVLATLEVQRTQLQRQAKQAARYRTLSAQIRKLEATVWWLRWQAAEAALAAAQTRLAAAEQAVAGATAVATQASLRQADAAAAVPDLRRCDGEAAAALVILGGERDALDAEERRVSREAEAARAAMRGLDDDLRRDEARGADATTNRERLISERERLLDRRRGEAADTERAEAALATASARVDALDAQATRLTEQLAASRARRGALQRGRDEAAAAARRAQARRDEAMQRQQAARAEEARITTITEVEAGVAAAEAEAEAARSALAAAETERAQLSEAEAEAVLALRDAETRAARLAAEEAALREVLAGGGNSTTADAVMDTVRVPNGMEAALAAALGDDLLAGCDASAPAFWRSLPPHEGSPPLPDGVLVFPVTDAPPVLARRLGCIGVVASEQDGERLQAALHPGQRLVTAEGAGWRWDGYTRRAGAPAPAAVRLRQRARLEELHPQRIAADETLQRLRLEHDQHRAAARAAMTTDQQARTRLRTAEAALRAAEGKLAELRTTRLRVEQKLVTAEETLAGATREAAEATDRLSALEAELAALPADAGEATALDALRADLGRARTTQAEARARRDSLLRDAAGRTRRLQAVEAEISSWEERLAATRRELATRTERRREITAALAALDAQPPVLAEQRRSLLDRLQTAEAGRRAAADAVAAGEAALTDAERALRAAERSLGEAREQRVRAEAEQAQAGQTTASVTDAIRERLEVQPQDLAEIIDGPLKAELDVAGEERRLDKLRREREVMGPVNLRADTEEAELATQISELQSQRGDLLEAVTKLRRATAELDREGRERLRTAFAEVDRHFQALFTRLFRGGHAHLALTDTEDPLQSGLEVMASPPGKKLQLMSLLSGGEQTLTALALRFALFLGRPAPVCVLDEVDAALDDANVDRFCLLLADLADRGTRFLVITHHRLTMARMHRLFGVTMVERGVSRLVSVDLRQADPLRRSA
ncbi:MAG: AAA family ATPase [Rhodospirillales bacterium]|nr:AAA family ATPase [Rhodospirillales bacterium]